MRHCKRPFPQGPTRLSVALAWCGLAFTQPACTTSMGEVTPPMGAGGSGSGMVGGSATLGGNGSIPPNGGTTAGAGAPSTAGKGSMGGAGAPATACAGAADPRLVVAPQRTLRLTGRQYLNSVRKVVGAGAADALSKVAALQERLNPALRKFPPLSGEPDNIIGTEYTSLETYADAVSKYVLENFATATGCSAPATDACATDWLKSRAALTYRRPLTGAEQTRFTDLYTKLKSQEVNGYVVTNTVEQATSSAMNALLLSPQFLWRWEIGNAQATSASPPGVYLTDLELASNLSFFLTDEPPDQQLVEAASKNDGSFRTNLRTHVDRLLGDQLTKDWLTQVFETSYGINQLPDVPIDDQVFPIWNTELMTGMLTEANQFLKSVLFNGQLTDLFLSRNTFVNPLLATEIYKIPVPAGATSTNLVSVTLPSDQRVGILTNPAFLAARGRSNGLGLVVPRGRMVTAAILCMPPDPPPEEIKGAVEAATATIATTTAQQQVASRKAGLCGTCHAQIDPYGLVLEYYDNLGRYRTTDHLGMAVDGTTKLPDLLGGTPVTSAVELAESLASSPAFVNCVARTALQYALVDFTAPVELPLLPKTAGCAVTDVVQKYQAVDGKTFSDLVRAITDTPAFALRQPVAP